MKLTGKIVLVYMFVMALLTAYFGYSIANRQHDRLEEELEEKAEGIGDAMERQLVVVWQNEGHEGVVQYIQRASSQHEEFSLRWIALNVGQLAPDLATTLERLQSAVPGDVLAVDSAEHHHMYYPIDVASKRAGVLEFSQPQDEIDQYTRGTIYRTSKLILGMFIGACVFTVMGVRTIGERLHMLIDKTREIGRGEFTKPLQLRGNDELNQLADALNEMSHALMKQQAQIQAESTSRVAAVEQLRHVDRLNTVGRLASGVAHELGTPLNVVSGRAELIASGQLDEEESRESALTIKSEAVRMTNIIRQLLDFARRRPPQRQSIDLRHVADQCVDLLQSLATKHGVELVVSGSDLSIANVDGPQIQQVLTNLVVNAVQAMPDGGTVSICLEQRRMRPPGKTDASEANYCCISVTDEGLGIRDEDRTQLFEPFFTTKEVGEGTGLGLSVSYGIVQDHDGWIDVQSVSGRGSCFTVYLPSE